MKSRLNGKIELMIYVFQAAKTPIMQGAISGVLARDPQNAPAAGK
jgi:hypothetical protein